MKENQGGFIIQFLLIGIVLAIGLIAFAVYQNFTAAPPYTIQDNAGIQNAPEEVKNSQDLNSSAAFLDATDTTQIDAELNQLDSLSTSF